MTPFEVWIEEEIISFQEVKIILLLYGIVRLRKEENLQSI